jgi:hypothetical protein
MKETYPLREALLSCAVMLMTAGLTVVLLSIVAVLIVILWS